MLAADLVNDDGGVDGRPIADPIDRRRDGRRRAGRRRRARRPTASTWCSGATAARSRRRPRRRRPPARHVVLGDRRGRHARRPRPTKVSSPSACRRPARSWARRRSIRAATAWRRAGIADAGRDLRYAVSYVDDVYGRSVAPGAFDTLDRQGLTRRRPLQLRPPDRRTCDRSCARSARREPDVLVRLGLPRRRDRAAARARAPARAACSPTSARPPAIACRRSARPWARTRSACTPPTSRRPPRSIPRACDRKARRSSNEPTTPTAQRWDEDMSPAALAGFSAAWALFADVLPGGDLVSPLDVADAARTTPACPSGSLPERQRPAVRRTRHRPKPATTWRRRA